MNTTQVKEYLSMLQDQIIEQLERVDGKCFKREEWERP